MAASAGTSRPVRFHRRLSGQMEPPTYMFPVTDTSTTFRKGDGIVVLTAVSEGKVSRLSGVAAIGTLAGEGFVGFAYSAAAEAPTFPTSGGASFGGIVFISPAAVTADDPIPFTEYINVALALDDCIWVGHQLNNVTDITAPVRDAAAATGGLLVRMGMRESTPTGETSRVFVDSSVQGTGAAVVMPLQYAYPQMPQARSTTAIGDPYRIRLGASGTVNPAVEFIVTSTIFTSVSGQT